MLITTIFGDKLIGVSLFEMEVKCSLGTTMDNFSVNVQARDWMARIIARNREFFFRCRN
jgi:hypothetical protein